MIGLLLTEEERFAIAEAAADADDDCLPTRAETLRSLLARHDAGVWIPVGEQMPNQDQCVLTYTDFGMHVASVNEYQQWGPNHGDGWDFPTVTHWMPLPPPPEAP
jgi:Protein of unknown function (DUF551)